MTHCKELSALEFEGDEVEFILIDGVRWYTGYTLGKIVGFPYGKVTRLVRRKKILFDGLVSNPTVGLSGKMKSVLCFNRDGVLTFLNEIDWPRLEPEARRDRVIEFRKRVIQTVGKVMDGKLVPENSIAANINPDQLETDYKSRSITNVARTSMLWYQLKRQRPANPDTVNRTNAMYRHDFESLFGPLKGLNLPKDWRKKGLTDCEAKSLQLKELIEFGEHMQGNIDQELVNSHVLKWFKTVFPQHTPKYLSSLIEKTKQTKLLGEGDAT